MILEDATSSRKRINLTSPYTLTRIADGKVVDSGNIAYNGSYAVQDDANFAAFTVKRDVRLRALTELAERYKARMVGVFSAFANPEAMAKMRAERKN